MPIIDLTHTFQEAMPVYPGDPLPELKRIASLETDGFTDHLICTGMHAGTHMDGPLHMLERGEPLSQFPVERFFGRGRIVDARGREIVTEDLIDERSMLIEPGDILLVFTGWSQFYGDPDYFTDYPQLSLSFARLAVERGVGLIGLDTPSPDGVPYAVHHFLLSHNVLIIENLTNLESLLSLADFEIIALPAKFQADSAPVRVVARGVEKKRVKLS